MHRRVSVAVLTAVAIVIVISLALAATPQGRGGAGLFALLDGSNVFTGERNRFESIVEVRHSSQNGFHVSTDFPSGDAFGVQAIVGEYNNAAGSGTGVQGLALGLDGVGVQGHANVAMGGIGVTGAAVNPGGTGVLGLSQATSGFAAGVVAVAHSPDADALSLANLGGGNLLQGKNDFADPPVIIITNDGQVVQGSSAALKTDVEPLDRVLERVAQLNGVRFRWKASGRTDIGFLAEEVAEVVPEVVHFDPEDETAQGIEYGRMTALLVEAIKEQEARIRELEARVEELSRRR